MPTAKEQDRGGHAKKIPSPFCRPLFQRMRPSIFIRFAHDHRSAGRTFHAQDLGCGQKDTCPTARLPPTPSYRKLAETATYGASGHNHISITTMATNPCLRHRDYGYCELISQKGGRRSTSLSQSHRQPLLFLCIISLDKQKQPPYTSTHRKQCLIKKC